MSTNQTLWLYNTDTTIQAILLRTENERQNNQTLMKE